MDAEQNERSELETLTDYQKCFMVFKAVCEGVDCELSYDELLALQENGYIEDLKRVKKNRWSFMWTDKLRDYAIATPQEQERMLKSGIANQSDGSTPAANQAKETK